MVHCNNSSVQKIRPEGLPCKNRIACKELPHDLEGGRVAHADSRFTARAVHLYLLTAISIRRPN
jgi:hypothetical protein